MLFGLKVVYNGNRINWSFMIIPMTTLRGACFDLNVFGSVNENQIHPVLKFDVRANSVEEFDGNLIAVTVGNGLAVNGLQVGSVLTSAVEPSMQPTIDVLRRWVRSMVDSGSLQ